MSKSGSAMDMSDTSMGDIDEGNPAMLSPGSNDGTAASGPNVAALGEALETPVEITDLLVSMAQLLTLCHCPNTLLLARVLFLLEALRWPSVTDPSHVVIIGGCR